MRWVLGIIAAVALYLSIADRNLIALGVFIVSGGLAAIVNSSLRTRRAMESMAIAQGVIAAPSALRRSLPWAAAAAAALYIAVAVIMWMYKID